MTKLPVAVLISGSGRTLENFIVWMNAGRLDLDIRLVISSKAGVKGLEVAQDAGIATTVIEKDRSLKGQEEYERAYSQQIFDACRQANVDYVVMAGFIQFVLIPADFENRVTNIHPGLIPAFCGEGFFGDRVHREVIDFGAKISGCTVHFVDNQFDHGPIILQQVVSVESADTVESLAQRVFQAECEAYPTALQKIAQGKCQIDGRRVTLD